MNEAVMDEANARPQRTPRLRIEVKVSEEQKDVITRAADVSRKGVSEFVREAAERAARDLLSRTP